MLLVACCFCCCGLLHTCGKASPGAEIGPDWTIDCRVGQMLAGAGQFRPCFGEAPPKLLDVGQTSAKWPTLSNCRPNLGDAGQTELTWPTLGQVRRSLRMFANVWPNRTVDQRSPNVGQVWQHLAKMLPDSAKFGRAWAESRLTEHLFDMR